MQMNSWTTKAVIGVGILAIIIAGALVVRRITASSDNTPVSSINYPRREIPNSENNSSNESHVHR